MFRQLIKFKVENDKEHKKNSQTLCDIGIIHCLTGKMNELEGKLSSLKEESRKARGDEAKKNRKKKKTKL
jgi:hypothetical protein